MSIAERHLFTWLHLSDLHFGHGTDPYQWNQKRVLELLKKDIANALEKWPELPCPQAIIVTGDIAFSGGVVSKNEYKDAGTFLRDLVQSFAIDPKSVYLIPGNHDVQRDVHKTVVDKVRNDLSSFDSILKTKDGNALAKRQANYKKFADDFCQRDINCWEEKINVPNFGTISILGMNTAVLSSDDQDHGQLVLSGNQKQKLSGLKSDINILLTHHPFEGGWIDDEISVKSIAEQHCRLHLCGHVHDPRVELISEAGTHHHIRVVAAAAHRDPKEAKDGKDSHGYNFSSLMLDASGNLQLRTWPRRWFPKWSSFRVDYLGVPDRAFYDDKLLLLGKKHSGSGLVLEDQDSVRHVGVHWWGNPSVRWKELLYGKSTFDIFGIAVRDLFEDPNNEFLKALANRGGDIRVVLADPRFITGMARYDEDFNKPLGDRASKVLDALNLLDALNSELTDATKLRVYLSRYTFKYSAYRIDGEVLFVPYRIVPGKNTVKTPGMLFDKESTVVKDFLSPDLDGILETAELLTPEVRQQIREIYQR